MLSIAGKIIELTVFFSSEAMADYPGKRNWYGIYYWVYHIIFPYFIFKIDIDYLSHIPFIEGVAPVYDIQA